MLLQTAKILTFIIKFPMELWKYHSRTAKISADILPYFSFQGNLVNFYPQSEILQIG